MFLFKVLFLFAAFLSPWLSEGQTLRKQRMGQARVEKPYYRIAFALETWQETMKLKSGADEANMRAQSDGLSITGTWLTPLGRWERYYGIEFALGRVKGKGSTASVPDELNDQPWFGLGGVGGYAYRTSPVSKLGVSLSALYRRINWKLESGTDLDIESKPFGLGLGFQYIITLSKRSSFVAAATHQALWSSTVWSIGYQANFL